MNEAAFREHHIELYDDTPIRQKPRRFPEPVVDEVEQQCTELKDMGIIEESHSPWSSAIVPIPKKNGSLRLCIDYRRVNKITKPDRFPTPSLNDLIFSLHGTQYFTSLDLIRGYYQSGDHCIFNATKSLSVQTLGIWSPKCSVCFQRNMQEVLQDFNWKNVMIYIDDVLIMEKTFERHLALVEKVLDTFLNHRIKIKASKCCWFQNEVPFLDHVVCRTGMKKDPKYINSVEEFPRPETVENETVSKTREFPTEIYSELLIHSKTFVSTWWWP